MSNTIQVRRGAQASLPVLAAGRFGFTTDEYRLYIGDGAANHEVAMIGNKGIFKPLECKGPAAITTFDGTASRSGTNQIGRAHV